MNSTRRWRRRLYQWRAFDICWRCDDGREVKIILEVKGFETERERQKEAAAKRWVRAVNHHGEFGQWTFTVCRDPHRLVSNLASAVATLREG